MNQKRSNPSIAVTADAGKKSFATAAPDVSSPDVDTSSIENVASGSSTEGLSMEDSAFSALGHSVTTALPYLSSKASLAASEMREGMDENEHEKLSEMLFRGMTDYSILQKKDFSYLFSTLDLRSLMLSRTSSMNLSDHPERDKETFSWAGT